MSDNKLLLKIIFTTLLCSFGLIYQSWQLIAQFIKGTTLVQITIGREFNETLPGVTICLNYFLAPGRIAEYDPVIKDKYREYNDLVWKYIENRNESENENYFKEFEIKFREITYNSFPIILKENVHDILANFSVIPKLHDSDLVNAYSGYLAHQGNFMPIDTTIMFDIKDIIESYRFTGFGPDNIHKCFTLHSSLFKYWRDFKMVLLQIKFTPSHFIYWEPPPNFKNVLFSLHSPNDFPKFTLDESWLNVEPGHDYKVSFSQLFIQRLGVGYDTNCRVYDQDYIHGNFNSRSDCLLNCYQDKMRQYLNQDGLYFSEFLMRKEHFQPKKTIFESFPNIDPDHTRDTRTAPDSIQFKFKIECMGECQDNCKTSIYPFDTEKFEIEPGDFKRKGWTQIELSHNGMPDIFVTHLPETTFIAFVCNFGGLLGMWLGLSVWAVFDDITKRFTHLVYKVSHSPDNYNHSHSNKKRIIKKAFT